MAKQSYTQFTLGLGMGSQSAYDSTNNRLGIGRTDPQARLNVYDDTSGVSTNTGITVEQDGTGDSLVQYQLTGTRRWVTGIDNSDGDKFKIASNTDLSSGNTRLAIDVNGLIGMGTDSPGSRLDLIVTSNIKGLFVDRDITNTNHTASGAQIDHTSVVNDAGTYTKTGAALQINTNVTETSGSITDSSQGLDINQTHTDATGNVVDIENRGSGQSIAVRDATGVVFQVSPSGNVVINERGLDADTRIEGDTDQNLIFVDASVDRVGISNSTPGAKLDVQVTGSNADSVIRAVVDSSNATQSGLIVKDNTNFAHAGALAKFQMVNATDSGNVVRIENSGTGKNISSASGTTETFSVAKDGSVVADTDTFIVDASGNKIGLGTSTPGTTTGFSSNRLEIHDASGSNSDILQRVASSGTPALDMVSSGGTLASPSASSLANSLGELRGWGHTGSAYKNAAQISLSVDNAADGGSVSSTSMPGSIIFYVTKQGAVSPVERMRITNAGFVGIFNDSVSVPNSRLHLDGSMSGKVVTKTANYTLDDDFLVIADAAGGAITMTLPTAVGITGRIYKVKRINSGINAVTIATTSSQTIDGVTTQSLAVQYASITVTSNGSNWLIV